MRTWILLALLSFSGLFAAFPTESRAVTAGKTSGGDKADEAKPAEAGAVRAARLPDTVAGKRVADYIKAFNSDDQNDMRLFLEANLSPEALGQKPVEARLPSLRQVKTDAGRLELRRVSEAREDAITVVALGATGKWVEISFAFEPQAPYRFLGARFQLSDEPLYEGAGGPPMTKEQLVAKLSEYIDSLVARDEFSGVVLLAKSDVPLFRKAYGLASKEYGVPNRVDTRFNLGSINKVFTEIAIEQLVASGAVSMDDTIGKFLPDYPNQDAATNVTVRELVNMTSGIGDFFGQRYADSPKDRLRDLADYLPLFADEPLAFAPGTSSAYSNGGYVVLGRIVEKASGQSYFDYVREHICDPAGMENTGYLESDVPVEGVASGYTRTWDWEDHPGEPRRNNIYTRPARGSSAGGGYSTVDDLLRFVLALKAGELAAPGVSSKLVQQGAGIAGGAPGINAYVQTLPRVGYTVVVLSNYDPPVAINVGRQMARMVNRLK